MQILGNIIVEFDNYSFAESDIMKLYNNNEIINQIEIVGSQEFIIFSLKHSSSLFIEYLFLSFPEIWKKFDNLII